MKVRHGRYGAFLGCTRYPECKGIINIPKKGETAIPQENLPPCPAIDVQAISWHANHALAKRFTLARLFPIAM